MQILPLDKDRVVAVDGDTVRVLKKADLQEELERANYNIQELGVMITELEKKVASTDGLDEKQAEVVNQFNDSLDIKRFQQELEQFKQTKLVLESK